MITIESKVKSMRGTKGDPVNVVTIRTCIGEYRLNEAVDIVIGDQVAQNISIPELIRAIDNCSTLFRCERVRKDGE